MFAALSKTWSVTKAAWIEERKRPKSTLQRQELAFLPAAVEVVETPASPVGRGVALTLMAVVVIALIWAWFGRIDTVAVAQGRIIPGGQVKTIQPIESAVVAAIHVKEGGNVQAGDLLLTFDPTDREVDKGQVKRELTEALLEMARLSATLAVSENRSHEAKAASLFDEHLQRLGLRDTADPKLAPLIATQRERMVQDLTASKARMQGYERQIEQQGEARRALLAEVRQFNQALPLMAEREAGLASLLATGMTERWRWLEVKQALIEARGQVEATKHRIKEIDALIASLTMEREEAEAAYRQQLHADLSASRTQADLSRLALRRAEQWEERQYLRSPVDGIVQQLKVHTIGGVVTPAEPLMIIVPKEAALEIEAMALNRDIGFIEAGQSAEIKIEAFPFTRYGLIEGKVTQISADAVADEELGLVYPLKASMAQTEVLVDNRWIKLTPGMTASVEVKTGQRRLLEFFLSPFLKYQDEALRER